MEKCGEAMEFTVDKAAENLLAEVFVLDTYEKQRHTTRKWQLGQEN